MEDLSRSTRIDVQVKLKRMVELMQRSQGATVREICDELNCNPKTFYRHLDKLLQLDIPYEIKPDPEGATNSVRYYISEKTKFCSDVALSSTEKALFKLMLQSSSPLFAQNSANPEIIQKFYNKLNDGISHELRESEYIYKTDTFSLKRKWDINDNVKSLSTALDLKQTITFKTIRKSNLKNEDEFINTEDKSFFLPYTLLNKDGIFYALGKVVPFGVLDYKNTLPVKIRCIKLSDISDIKFYKQYTYSISKNYNFSNWYDYYFSLDIPMEHYYILADDIAADKIMNACEYYPVEQSEKDNQTQFIFHTNKRTEFKTYLRTLGSGVQVIKPLDFVTELKEEFKSIISKYEEK